MMTTTKQDPDHKNILLALIFILVAVAVVQSVFLVKLHRAVEKDRPTSELEKYRGGLWAYRKIS